jgi:enoyl-[acyl-carrier protein] reductase II
MDIRTKVTELLGIRYPVIQAGMVWVSGWKLASAVAENGGLGLIGAGSMKAELLREHIKDCRSATSRPFGVNIPLLREDASQLLKVVIQEEVKIVFTSAGNPNKFIEEIKNNNITAIHVVSSLKQAKKAEEAGYDAVVGEGVEAGGHNGVDQMTTFCLIPILSSELKIPVIAAGGITDGKGILAALALGAEGVQIGTRFAASTESSAHPNYKKKIMDAGDSATLLAFSKIGLVRMLKNDFSERALKAELEGWGEEELRELLGTKRERLGIFEGDETEGQMEAGQGAGLIKEILPVEEIFRKLISGYNDALKKMNSISGKL